MPKTQEELTQLKTEYETLNNKLKELTEDELKMVTGGSAPPPNFVIQKHDCIPDTYTFTCNKCGHVWQHSFDPLNLGETVFSYCPNCHEKSTSCYLLN